MTKPDGSHFFLKGQVFGKGGWAGTGSSSTAEDQARTPEQQQSSRATAPLLRSDWTVPAALGCSFQDSLQCLFHPWGVPQVHTWCEGHAAGNSPGDVLKAWHVTQCSKLCSGALEGKQGNLIPFPSISSAVKFMHVPKRKCSLCFSLKGCNPDKKIYNMHLPCIFITHCSS